MSEVGGIPQDMLVDWKGGSVGRLSRAVIIGTVARFKDRFVSVVVLKSNSYDDGCALLHGAELGPLITRKYRRKALSHQ